MASTSPNNADPERKFARRLASNDLKVRNKALKRLKMYISIRSKTKGEFTHLEMMKLWKGLYYCMWMSDKPLVQEDLADKMTTLIDCFNTPQQAVQFISAFYQTMAREWSMLDRLRLDKFMMLIRKYFHSSLDFLKKNRWNKDLVASLAVEMRDHVLNPSPKSPCGLQNHLADVFMTEIKKVADITLTPEVLELLLDPFVKLLACTRSVAVHKCLKEGMFEGLIRSTMTGILMKRDGKDPNLVIDCPSLSELFLTAAIDKTTVGRNRKTLYELKTRFQELAEQCDSTQPPVAAVHDFDGVSKGAIHATEEEVYDSSEEVDGGSEEVDGGSEEVDDGSEEVDDGSEEVERSTESAKSRKTKKRKTKLAKSLDYEDEQVESHSKSHLDEHPLPAAKKVKKTSQLMPPSGGKKGRMKVAMGRRKLRKRLTATNVSGTPFADTKLSPTERKSSVENIDADAKLQKQAKEFKGSKGGVLSLSVSSLIDLRKKKIFGTHKHKLEASERKRKVSFTSENNKIQKFKQAHPVSPYIKPANPNPRVHLSPEGIPRGILRKSPSKT